MRNTKYPTYYYEQRDSNIGLVASIILHIALVLIAILFAQTNNAASGPVQLELWTEGTEQIVAPPAETSSPTPDEEDTKTLEPEPEVEPEVTPTPVPEAAPAPKPVAESPPEPSIDTQQADIVLEKKQKEEAEAERKKIVDQKTKEEAEKKAEAERKKIADQKAKEEAEKKAEAERKKIADQKAKEEAEKKAKELAAAQAAKLAAEKKAKANSKKEALRAAMRGDINSRSGIKNGRNDRNQRGGGGGTNHYARAVQQCVQPRLIFNGPQRLKLKYRVKFNETRTVTDAKIVITSGNPGFDVAVLKALRLCKPFPKPPGNNRVVEGFYDYRPR